MLLERRASIFTRKRFESYTFLLFVFFDSWPFYLFGEVILFLFLFKSWPVYLFGEAASQRQVGIIAASHAKLPIFRRKER